MNAFKCRILAIESAVTLRLSPLEKGLLKFIRDEVDPDFTPDRQGQCYGIWLKTIIDDDNQERYKKWVNRPGNKCAFEQARGYGHNL